MRRTCLNLLLSVLLMFAVVPVASAQNSFDDLVSAGIAAYQSGDYDKAIENFLKARIMQDEPVLTYNIARSYHKKGECLPAVENYNKYMGRKGADPANVDKAKGYLVEIGECSTEGTLSMTCTPGDANVKIGTQEKGPCSDFALEQGDYVVIVTKDGYTPRDFRVTIKPDQIEPLVAVLEKIPEVVGPTGPEEPGPNILAWSLVGTGGLLIVGAVAVDLVNLFINEEELKQLSLTHPDRKSFEDSYKLNQVLILTLGGLGIAAAATGAVLLILDATSEEDTTASKSDEDSSGVSWSVAPSINPRGDVGAVFELRF